MIRYTLQCKKGHDFDGWFQNSTAFDKQAKRKLVACPACGSTDVSKSLMAPRVTTGKQKDKARTEVAARVAVARAGAAAPVEAVAAAQLTPEQKEVVDLMRKLRKEVEANAEYVGPRFAEEARKIHDEDAPERGIFGEASLAEVKELHDDGIECFPLPVLPEDSN